MWRLLSRSGAAGGWRGGGRDPPRLAPRRLAVQGCGRHIGRARGGPGVSGLIQAPSGRCAPRHDTAGRPCCAPQPLAPPQPPPHPTPRHPSPPLAREGGCLADTESVGGCGQRGCRRGSRASQRGAPPHSRRGGRGHLVISPGFAPPWLYFATTLRSCVRCSAAVSGAGGPLSRRRQRRRRRRYPQTVVAPCAPPPPTVPRWKDSHFPHSVSARADSPREGRTEAPPGVAGGGRARVGGQHHHCLGHGGGCALLWRMSNRPRPCAL